MSSEEFTPGYYLPRGHYKRRKGKTPQAAKRLFAEERAIVERTRLATEKLKQKEHRYEQATLPEDGPAEGPSEG